MWPAGVGAYKAGLQPFHSPSMQCVSLPIDQPSSHSSLSAPHPRRATLVGMVVLPLDLLRFEEAHRPALLRAFGAHVIAASDAGGWLGGWVAAAWGA